MRRSWGASAFGPQKWGIGFAINKIAGESLLCEHRKPTGNEILKGARARSVLLVCLYHSKLGRDVQRVIRQGLANQPFAHYWQWTCLGLEFLLCELRKVLVPTPAEVYHGTNAIGKQLVMLNKLHPGLQEVPWDGRR